MPLYQPSGPAGPQGPAGEGVPADGLTGQVLAKASDTSFDTEWIDNYAESVHVRVKNAYGSNIAAGTPVTWGGTSVNGMFHIVPADTSAWYANPPQYQLGVTATDIDDGDEGYISLMGEIKHLDTSMYNVGDTLYSDPMTPGAWTTSEPMGPALSFSWAVVTHSDDNNGRIYVRMYNQGQSVGSLYDVNTDPGLEEDDVLSYEYDTGLWTGKPVSLRRTYSKVIPINPSIAAEASGTRYFSAPQIGPGTGLAASGFSPIMFSEDFYVDTVGLLLAATNTGTAADFRIGIYSSNPNAALPYAPYELVADFGTIAIANGDTAGLKTLSASPKVQLYANQIYWVGCRRSGGNANTVMVVGAGICPLLESLGVGAGAGEHNVSGLSLAGDGATALPSTFDSSPYTTRNIVNRVYLKGTLTP